MKQTIEIEVPDGKKAVWKDGTIIFEDIRPNLPKTWEEFCENYPVKKGECFIDSDSIITESIVGGRLYRCDRNILPSAESAEQHLALMKLHQLRDCYRQGWKPDWEDDDNKKYGVFIIGKDFNIQTIRSQRNFLTFQSREIASEFINNFGYLIKEAEDLI